MVFSMSNLMCWWDMQLCQDLFSTQFIGVADSSPPHLGMTQGQEGDERSHGHGEITRENSVGEVGIRLPETTYILVGEELDPLTTEEKPSEIGGELADHFTMEEKQENASTV